MRPVSFHPERLTDLLRRRTVTSMPELMAALGTSSRQTVLRKLKALDYLTSYSHRRRYYALRASACFDADGLWSHGQARFSRHGTLLATVETLATESRAGLSVSELDALLGVAAKDPLRKLAGAGRLARETFAGRFLYCASDPARRTRQLRARQLRAGALSAAAPAAAPADSARTLFISLLDERLRRLYAGLESLRRGRGGDRRVAQLLRLDPGTVRRGRLELLSGKLQRGPVRKPGGGRKSLEKKPALVTALTRLLERETAGDPCGGAKWSRRSTRKLAVALGRQGFQVGARTVSRLLRRAGFSLRVNRKQLANATHPDRDAQFQRIAAERARCAAKRVPIISVDTKICAAAHILVYAGLPDMWS